MNRAEQKAAKVTVFDLQQDPAAPGLKFHRVNKSKDPNFWSVRVNDDLRIIIHKTDDSFLICHIGHHDDAYAWAERRRIEVHPRTGAAQIVQVRERIDENGVSNLADFATSTALGETSGTDFENPARSLIFADLTTDDLLSVGVPEDWLDDIRKATEEAFFEIAERLPDEAAEALLEYATTGRIEPQEIPASKTNPFDHPDAQRRFRILDNVEELRRALDYPWDQWSVFLHPSQRSMVDADFSGPARVAGSAGTGKTVVALHRAANILISDPKSKVLLTTFSSPLANALNHKLRILVGENAHILSRVTVLPFQGIASEMFMLTKAHDPRPAKLKHIQDAIGQASQLIGDVGFSDRFLLSEWRTVVDAWDVRDFESYSSVPRLGRKNRLGAKQRERIWPIFEAARGYLKKIGVQTWAEIFGTVTAHFGQRSEKPFSHIIVDEAQDLGVSELRMLVALAPTGSNRLFFAGDLGQRIFQEPFSWKSLGVDIRGRSKTLKVNYRTSHQIRIAADRLLPSELQDVDGIEENREGVVSIFNGPLPEIRLSDNPEDEAEAVSSWIKTQIARDIPPSEIGIFVRSDDELARARQAIRLADQTPLELSDRVEDRTGRISMGSMHLAKGLEFKCVGVMACDDDVLPRQDRIETVADQAELDEVYETERQLFYVACTRARETLLVSGVSPASEFLEDLTSPY